MVVQHSTYRLRQLIDNIIEVMASHTPAGTVSDRSAQNMHKRTAGRADDKNTEIYFPPTPYTEPPPSYQEANSIAGIFQNFWAKAKDTISNSSFTHGLKNETDQQGRNNQSRTIGESNITRQRETPPYGLFLLVAIAGSIAWYMASKTSASR
ncbi:hypothetical protein BJ166DRAFT_25211 [Pestalotiopsis sp. NC0098]|nr:hypothetical protein BJ166DRAFT_25211 [Pestalotiopsis sp. NC0098]